MPTDITSVTKCHLFCRNILLTQMLMLHQHQNERFKAKTITFKGQVEQGL